MFAHESPAELQNWVMFTALLFILMIALQVMILRSKSSVPGEKTIQLNVEGLSDEMAIVVQEAVTYQAETLVNKIRHFAEERDEPITRAMIAEAWSKTRLKTPFGLEW